MRYSSFFCIIINLDVFINIQISLISHFIIDIKIWDFNDREENIYFFSNAQKINSHQIWVNIYVKQNYQNVKNINEVGKEDV